MSVAPLFSTLSGFASEMRVAAGDIILQSEEVAQGAYLITSGRVCSSILNEHGAPTWSRVDCEGAIIGLASALAKTSQMFLVIALEPTTLRYIPREKLTKLVRDNVNVGTGVISLLSAEEVEMRRAWSQIAGMPPMR